MTTTKNEAHAISNARGQLETIKELYREFKKQEDLEAWDCGSNVYNWTTDGIQEEARNEALSVEFRSGWTSNLENMEPEEFKILLSTGGPACQIVGKIDDGSYEPIDIEIQYQDWFTPWESLQLNCTYADKSPNITSDYQALEWFCNCFYFGE